MINWRNYLSPQGIASIALFWALVLLISIPTGGFDYFLDLLKTTVLFALGVVVLGVVIYLGVTADRNKR